ncbi:SufS family cysteine desulfurase [Cardiobacterium valvarum]|uniref:Cysteine desulfurase n=1 Tax=Cardiobacterium valvarum F0432 TaxID=797473 RepID=G9ZDR7_9GAMM|nr:SufS family cysteine desulfurase [Cardiobacterium valvarum]EHM55148.1 cysteine desulfurase, SufS subfamily [Cardiobacterium valvarum F0432]
MRHEFPILAQTIHGQPLTYLDNAASTQKPLAVIEAMDHCYRHEYSNIHRGVHTLSQRLSARYDAVREKTARFLNAARPEEIVFTKSTTEGLNLLASSLGELVLKPGDKILLTTLEHHANIVPWQRACQRFGTELAVLPISDAGELDTTHFSDYLDGVKIFSATLVSNALGTINDLAPLIAQAKARGICTIVDAAQAVAHLPCDVQALGCDFLVFSAHKIYGPTGIGVLYGRHDLLDAMPPYQTGGDMILSVSFEYTHYAAAPQKFEAGTPPIVEVIGLGAALDWVTDKGLANLAAHEETLRQAAEQALTALPGLRIIGTARHKAAVISFTLDGIHPHDAGTVLDQHGIAVRVGQHCAEPVMRRFGIPATIRASFAAYNNHDDIGRLVAAVQATQQLFQ